VSGGSTSSNVLNKQQPAWKPCERASGRRRATPLTLLFPAQHDDSSEPRGSSVEQLCRQARLPPVVRLTQARCSAVPPEAHARRHGSDHLCARAPATRCTTTRTASPGAAIPSAGAPQPRSRLLNIKMARTSRAQVMTLILGRCRWLVSETGVLRRWLAGSVSRSRWRARG